jgi:hypothetical protein
MLLNPMNARPRIDPRQATQIKEWVTQYFGLPADTAILVTELQCTEDGCPPLETVIAILSTPGHPQSYKLHKAMVEVTVADIQALAHTT